MIYSRSNKIVPECSGCRKDRGEHALPNIASTNEESTTCAILFICHLQGISDVAPVPVQMFSSLYHLLLLRQHMTPVEVTKRHNFSLFFCIPISLAMIFPGCQLEGETSNWDPPAQKLSILLSPSTYNSSCPSHAIEASSMRSRPWISSSPTRSKVTSQTLKMASKVPQPPPKPTGGRWYLAWICMN